MDDLHAEDGHALGEGGIFDSIHEPGPGLLDDVFDWKADGADGDLEVGGFREVAEADDHRLFRDFFAKFHEKPCGTDCNRIIETKQGIVVVGGQVVAEAFFDFRTCIAGARNEDGLIAG